MGTEAVDGSVYVAALTGERRVAVGLGKGCVRCRKMDAIDFALIEALMVERRDVGSDSC